MNTASKSLTKLSQQYWLNCYKQPWGTNILKNDAKCEFWPRLALISVVVLKYFSLALDNKGIALHLELYQFFSFLEGRKFLHMYTYVVHTRTNFGTYKNRYKTPLTTAYYQLTASILITSEKILTVGIDYSCTRLIHLLYFWLYCCWWV